MFLLDKDTWLPNDMMDNYCIIRPVVSASTLTGFIRYIFVQYLRICV